MPTYEYLCESCRHQFEVFQSIMAGPLRKCPKCGRRKIKRLLGTGGGILFKGSGFYQTDYRSKSYQESAKKEDASKKSAPEPSPQASGEKKKETPSAQKSKEEK